MSITTTTTLPAPLQASFSMKLLSVPTPYLIHKIPADLKTMPRNGGTTLRMRRYNQLATAVVPLGNSGVTPPPQNLTAVKLAAFKPFLIDLNTLTSNVEGNKGQADLCLAA